ncbi:Uncharacterised protein [Candidatus Bilamarchaeum dharawalense]|uniref:TrbL/VirB6 plasmid conjugal transfer protein n=1 Tax=Candidatus Bilamarchaeum dharawalense TaxID=2885759 RepID=A0A5E4LSF2_9ARCH|nr:Uncharacterised protein [Candidatus Bilamarchaeum dharawalense]
MKLAYVLLLLFTLAYAVDPPDDDWIVKSGGCIVNATQGTIIEQGSLIAIVIAFTVVVIAAAYMIGSAINEAHWTVFAKDELYHLAFSIIFLIGLSAILAGSCYTIDGFSQMLQDNLGMGLSCGGTMQETAGCYMDKLQADANDLAEIYLDKQIKEMMDSTYAWSFALPLVNTYTLTGGSYKRVRSGQYETIFNSFIMPALISINMQKLMLGFIRENIIAWLLPIAFLLRIFIPTRQMGDLLLALCIGVYVVIPFMYVFEFSMYDVITSDDCTEFGQAICDKVVDGSCDNPASACDNSFGFWKIGKLIPFAFFFPNLTIVIFISFMSAVHKGLRAIG